MFRFEDVQLHKPMALCVENFELYAGQKYALLGPSGAGKTSFFRMIAGFYRDLSGRFCFHNEPIGNLPPSSRPVSYLFQSHNLFSHLDLRQNIALGLRANLRLNEAEWRRVDEMIEKLALEDHKEKFPRALSGGQNLRAALGRTILHGRELVLLDEAFSSVGPAQAKALRDLVDQELNTPDRVLVSISHQPIEAKRWADQVLWVDNGEIRAPVDKNHFFVNLPESAKTYLGDEFSQ